METNYNINTLWVYNLAKITNKYNIDFITISTDYVFDGLNKNWYNENEKCNPINGYWMAKYLWESLALSENKNSIIIRTSWLYGWWKRFKNFVNTMIKLSENHNELKVINDQFWIPTYTYDLSEAISKVIEKKSIYRWKIFHFSNSSKESISWFDFASKIFKITWKDIKINPCNSEEYKTKAKRPDFSVLLNNSKIILRDWKEGLKDYINKIN
jgi:dTDP-4-dehydrorhamnose reductase